MDEAKKKRLEICNGRTLFNLYRLIDISRESEKELPKIVIYRQGRIIDMSWYETRKKRKQIDFVKKRFYSM